MISATPLQGTIYFNNSLKGIYSENELRTITQMLDYGKEEEYLMLTEMISSNSSINQWKKEHILNWMSIITFEDLGGNYDDELDPLWEDQF